MKKYGDTISEGKACVVVRAPGLDQTDHEFLKWLRDEGFTPWLNHGHYKGCNWVFINLNSMIYAPGMPGVKITMPIRDLSGISIEDFKTIWAIFRYREDHPVTAEIEEIKRNRESSGICPVIPMGAGLCHIYDIADAAEAGKELRAEPVKSYGVSTCCRGTELHGNHESEGGGRALVRCKKCGALLLSQHSWYEALNPDFDGSFHDWIPVWSEQEADLMNIFLDATGLPDYHFRHLRSNNHKYFWVGSGQPRPMDLPELAKAIALKYEKELTASSEKDAQDSPIGDDVWQMIFKNLPQVKE